MTMVKRRWGEGIGGDEMLSKWENEQHLRDWKDMMCAQKARKDGVCNKYCDSDCVFHWDTIEYETFDMGE